jgi:hypothetical protein
MTDTRRSSAEAAPEKLTSKKLTCGRGYTTKDFVARGVGATHRPRGDRPRLLRPRRGAVRGDAGARSAVLAHPARRSVSMGTGGSRR